MFVFGSGVLIGTQLNVPNPTPINFGLVQKVSVDTSVSVKELYGQFAFPVAVGSGTRKVHVQGVLGALSAARRLGACSTTRRRLRARRSPSSPRSIASPAPARSRSPSHNATHFVADQGVTYAATGLPLICRRIVPSDRSIHGQPDHRRLHLLPPVIRASSVLISYTYTATSADDELRTSRSATRSSVRRRPSRRRCSRPTRRRTRSSR